MTLSASRVSSRSGFLLGAVAAALFALTPQTALAQHGGGGGHAGGGGGGGHFGGGGGGHFGGSSGGSHAAAPAPASHSSSKPPATFRPPSAPATQAGVHNGVSDNFSAGSRPLSFGGAPSGGAALSDAAVPHTTIGFPPTSASDAENSQLLVHGGILSFSGQGHEIWQNAPGATPGLGAAPSVLGGHPSGNQLQAQPRMFPPVRRPPIFFPGYGGYGTGFIYNPFLFGFGFDFGLNCNPFFWDPWDAWNSGCNSLGYWGPYSGGYYGPGAYLGAGGYGSTDAGSDASQGYSQYAPQSSASDNSESVTTPVVMLYLNDGTSFAVTDYWVADYKLHYVAEGREGALDLDQIDVQRTVDMNASRGVTFSLKPTPAAGPSSPQTAPQR
jgi:hypothetical protein